MENKTSLSSENRRPPAAYFYLKVDLNCCESCRKRAKEKLEKLFGVVAITIDKKQGLLGVSGTVDPQIIIRKFAKWGKKAELCAPVKESQSLSKQSSNACTTQSNQKSKIEDSKDSDSKNDSDSEQPTFEKGSNISWQHPDLVSNKPAPVSNKKSKKWPCFFGFCRRKDVNIPSFRPTGVGGGNMRPFGSRMGLHPGHGAYGLHQPPPFYYNRQLTHGRMGAQTPYSYHQPPPPYGYLGSGPPQPTPYGFRGSGPPPPSQQFNPMIHYTRYEDNYGPW